MRRVAQESADPTRENDSACLRRRCIANVVKETLGCFLHDTTGEKPAKACRGMLNV
jgi:hypothetical protein